MNQQSAIHSLVELLGYYYHLDDASAARAVAILLLAEGADVEIATEEPLDEDCSDSTLPRDKCVATTQSHRLLADGEEIAILEREGWSYYGCPDHPDTPGGEWTTDSAEGDHLPTRAWLAIADAIGDDGEWQHYPGAEEPEEIEPEEDPDGEYCLWWVSVGDDSGPLLAHRYATLADARAACQLADHALHVRHRGTLLCGYGIGVMDDDGSWAQLDDSRD